MYTRIVAETPGAASPSRRCPLGWVIPSDFTARYWRRTSASHSARRAALEPKWWVMSPGETPARAATVRNGASNPTSAKHSIAESRIRARAVRSDAGRLSSVSDYTHDQQSIRMASLMVVPSPGSPR